MKNHVKVYLKHFGQDYDEFDNVFLICEWCNTRRAVDVNHIDPRGMGGSKEKDLIENLTGMCRECHIRFEHKQISKEELRAKHLKILNYGKTIL